MVNMPMMMYDEPMPPLSAKTTLTCDVPFLDGPLGDLPFRTHSADVPEDLLACTPIHGWDTPPESPSHSPMYEFMSDPLLSTKVSAGLEASIFDDESTIQEVTVKMSQPQPQPVFDWTPPASPVPSAGCEDLLRDFPDLHFVGAPASTGAGASLTQARPAKRKATGPADQDRKLMKKRSEIERAQRTAACEKAVKELSENKNDEDPESRRHTHNVLERKRRNDLKNSYQLLREQLPTLEENDRAPTGQILLHAVEFIATLKKEEAELAAEHTKAKLENERLRSMTAERKAIMF